MVPGFREVPVGARYAKGLLNSTPELAAMSRPGCARYRAVEIAKAFVIENLKLLVK